MKKFWIIAGVLTLFLGSTVLHKQVNLNAEPEDSHHEKIAQEAERNRELLEIWKDHVKTLTKERDQAYQELERMRAGQGGATMAQFGAMESAPLPPSPEFMQQIDSLQSEVSRLQLELQKKASSSGGGPSSRELQMQLSALQSQFQNQKKELTQARDDKERALQDKEQAMSQSGQNNLQSSGDVRALQDDIAVLQKENTRLKSDLEQSIAYSGTATDRNAETFMRQARELQYENDSLKAQIEKLKVVEKELASTRAYFTPMVKALQNKSDNLVAENSSLATEVRRARGETDQHAQSLRSMEDQNQKLGADVQTLKKEQEEWASQIETYKSQLQMSAADKEKLRSVEEEFRRSQIQTQELQKASMNYEQTLAAKNAELKRLSEQLQVLERTNHEIESRETDNLKSVEKYQTALRANLTDMKNLKSNFEAYLESLVASFEERQR